MKFSFEALKTYLETSLSAQEIADALTNLGLEVESLKDPSSLLNAFKVGYIQETHPHPEADRLQICHVDIGEAHLQKIVCGAANARPGMWGVYAPLGSLIPSTGQILKSAKIRGVLSEGMLCSQKELGLQDISDGTIMELSGDIKPGMSFGSLFEGKDILFDLKITPNRPDCFGIYGIARDLAAKQLGSLQKIYPFSFEGTFESPLHVVKNPHLPSSACPQFMGCYIRGVKNCESPLWLKQFLLAAGLTPISGLVDITNYISIAFARPLHVFDAQKLTSPLTIRWAQDGETFEGLNGKSYALESSMMIIGDDSGVQSLAGIMGGAHSACSFDTTDVFLECALFDPVLIGKTGQKLMIQSDARQRFERGVDPASVPFGLHEGLRLILELCGGTPSYILNLENAPYVPRDISLFYPNVFKMTGMDVPAREVNEILHRLGFLLKSHTDTLGTFEIPSWRPDILKEEDVIEEVLRLKGYDTLPKTPLPPFSKSQNLENLLSPLQEKEIFLKRLLANRGFFELVTYSFISKEESLCFEHDEEALLLSNPISQDMLALRRSLIPSLLKVLAKNQNHGVSSASFFELSSLYKSPMPSGQILALTGLRKGSTGPLHWKKESRPFDIFDIKADVLSILEAWGIAQGSFQIRQDTLPSWFHPHLSGALYQGPKRLLGFFGALHPKVLKQFDLSFEEPVFAFELFLNAFPAPKYASDKKPLSLSPFQKVSRDFAFLIERSRPIQPLLEAIYTVAPQIIENILIFDVFEGKGLESHEKSVALRVVLTPQEETFTSAQIHILCEKIIDVAQKSVGARLRS